MKKNDNAKLKYKKSFRPNECCVLGCEEKAVARYPVFDIDQDTIPKPYCREHLDKKKDEFTHDLFLAMYHEDEKERKKKKY